MKLFKLIAITLLASSLSLEAQQLTQTIRGRVFDNDIQSALIGATIRVVDSTKTIGAVTDIEGEFRIENVPVGRVTLLIDYIGYEDRVISNLLVGSAKEVVLNIGLVESVNNLNEVVVSATKNKNEVLNEMVLVSARTFSVEETQRYAGAFNDPARMVSAFAGVTSNPEGNNDIVVRGNSPRGILWRLEGMEIPNPNHFAWEGSTGGPINALNSNMLSNSDFFSGAFSPEYGNALSGVFDMKLKKGNNEKREYTAGLSTLGVDFALEGPFKQGYNGSYLANYRYSSLALLDDLNLVYFGGVPKYQDLSFNVYLPVNKNHFISLFGLGGISSITSTLENDDEEVILKGKFGSDLGIAGITHSYLIDDKSFLKTTLMASATSMYSFDEAVEEDRSGFYTYFNADLVKSNFRWATTYNRKFNARHVLESGMILSHRTFNMFNDALDFERDVLERVFEDKGSTYTYQGFASWQYRFNQDLTMTSGLHYIGFALNNSHSIEPRMALQYKLNNQNSISIGVGIHSRLESISTYLAKLETEDGQTIKPNENLETTKAAHFVMGYDRMLNANTHMKLEAYYQHLYDVPIEDSVASTFSLLNMSDSYVNTPLVNEGTGRNYGLEFTLEQYLVKGFYYMITASLYESLYTPMDGKERRTAYDGNFAFNILFGKEFAIGQTEKNRVLFVNSKTSLLGGKRYTPIDFETSQELGYEVRYDDRPFSARSDEIFIANVSVGIRRNKKSTARELKFDVQNAINAKAVVQEYFVPELDELVQGTQLPLLPNISYTISF
jgi:hypothetical protein